MIPLPNYPLPSTIYHYHLPLPTGLQNEATFILNTLHTCTHSKHNSETCLAKNGKRALEFNSFGTMPEDPNRFLNTERARFARRTGLASLAAQHIAAHSYEFLTIPTNSAGEPSNALEAEGARFARRAASPRLALLRCIELC